MREIFGPKIDPYMAIKLAQQMNKLGQLEKNFERTVRAMSLWSKKKVKKIGSLDDKIKNKTSKLSVVERMCAESRNKTEALVEFSKVESGKVDFEKVESNTVESDKIELEKLESIKITKKMSETNQNKINEHGSEGKVLPGTNRTNSFFLITTRKLIEIYIFNGSNSI